MAGAVAVSLGVEAPPPLAGFAEQAREVLYRQVAPARQLAPQDDDRQPLPLAVGQGGAPGAHPLVRRRDPGPGVLSAPRSAILGGVLACVAFAYGEAIRCPRLATPVVTCAWSG